MIQVTTNALPSESAEHASCICGQGPETADYHAQDCPIWNGAPQPGPHDDDLAGIRATFAGTAAMLHEAWAGAYPLASWGGVGSEYWHYQSRGYRAATRVFERLRRLQERAKAARALLHPDEGCDYLGRRARLHALALLLLPVVWNGRLYEPREGKRTLYFDEVTSWDGHEWAGNEQTNWEATFIATRRFGLARIYRDSGP